MYIYNYIIYIYIYKSLHIWASKQQILPGLPHLQSKNSPEVQNVMIPHQPKLQRFIKRRGTSCEMVLLRISLISVAYSSV